MKFKSILLTAVVTLGLTAATLAQNVPNYVPTNGLVSWWPFNGNANDESGNGNNGIVNGATLTTNRFGINNACYYFDGNDLISINDFNALNFGTGNFTYSVWFKSQNVPTSCTNNSPYILAQADNVGTQSHSANQLGRYCSNQFRYISQVDSSGNLIDIYPNTEILPGNWYHIIVVRNGNLFTLYKNGQAIGTTTSSNPVANPISAFNIGGVSAIFTTNFHQGEIDDIGIWNRALTQQEITDLFNAVNCANNTTITPQTNSLATGSTTSFTAITSDPNPSYVWQSDLGQGFQTLNNFGNYSGANSATLNISNVQVSEHNQPIRVISTSGNCIDTSNVAVINILDTCITNVTIYDTLLTTVTDTLVINATITGINPPNNLNTLKVFPNPANTHITIDYGNFNAMSGYTLTIVNSIGQTVFTTLINQQTSYIDLSTWTGNGIYFVQLIDPQNNTIENRKIVIQ